MQVLYIQDERINKCNGKYYHPKSKHFFDKYRYGLSRSDTLVICCCILACSEEDANKYCEIELESTIFVSLPDLHKITNLYNAKKIVKKLIKTSDLCYVRVGIAAMFAYRYCRKYSKKYISIVNEDIETNMLAHKSAFVRVSAIPIGWINKKIVSKASNVCYVTKYYLQSKYPNKNECLGCSDVENLEIDDNILLERLNKIHNSKGRKLILGTVGSVDAKLKAHDVVISALSIIKKRMKLCFSYEIVGKGNTQRLKEYSQNKSVYDEVTFLGELSHDDVIDWMDNIDIYVHPSKSEGLPRTILEAISRGLPCICSKVGGIPELVDEQYLISYDEGKPAKQLADLIADFTEEKLIKAATENFNKAKEYNPIILERRQRDFFSKIIEASRSEIGDGKSEK